MSTKISNTLKARAVSPKLRFSGFKVPWTLKPINQLLQLTERPFKMADNGVYSLIKVKRGNNGVVHRGDFEGRKVLVKSQFLVATDDFVISKRQIVHQACGIVPKELNGSIVSNEYDVFVPTPECCIQYFDYITYRPQMRHAFFLSCVGVHLEKMLFKTNDWLKRKFYFPSVHEQRKIADFLTAVDKRIAQLRQKKSLLEAYKKGVMQKLFTQALRFQDDHGNDFPDWEERMLGDFCTCFSGGTPSSGSRDYYGGLIPFIRSAEIASENTALFLTEKGLKESAAKMVNVGDLLVALYGANSGEVGISKINGAINQAILCIRTNESAQFLYFWLEHSKQTIVNTYLQGGQGNLSGKIVQSLNISLPVIEEQIKIANFLTALDRKIEAVAAQIAHTQTWKKGLLQQMFV